MHTLVTLRQSPTLSRALIAEARAARRGSLADRVRAGFVRMFSRSGLDAEVRITVARR